MSLSSNYVLSAVYVICGNKFDEKMFNFGVFVCVGDLTTITQGTFTSTQTVTIASGSTPSFYFEYSVSESHCSLSYIVSTTSLGSTYPSEFDSFFTSGSGYKVPLKAAYREIEGTYDIHLKVEAKGEASEFTTTPFTLSVVCGDTSAQISPSTFSATQQVEVGITASVKFLIPEFSVVVAGCPILTYQVGTNSDPSSLPTGLS